ncbi:hypothetical protein [Spartinivicinus poritis]|uniref:Uncharacterized protein n=1 Tax=Spartinivicinus poritis TaxID=2994640 RepID=A0ABT5UH34_9GAMM|nr:hypothetical protein [Spartinivicinus sp. A2-2]MDE1465668.1 hypothetical protein [Spartinivicinus sp. A2-2]
MAYVNPPKINKTDLSSWTHQQQNYFWHPGAQQTEKPHLHLTGSTVSEVVTISNLSYTTTAGGTENINLVFNSETGFATIVRDIEYKLAYNIKIEDINNKLHKVEEIVTAD